jgi:hypothetical protein
MPASFERIRQEMKVEPTAQDNGLTLTIRIDAYDDGLIHKDGHSISRYSEGDWVGPVLESEVANWCDLMEIATVTVSEFRRQVMIRRKTRGHAR